MPNVPRQRRSGASATSARARQSQPIASSVRALRRQASARAKQTRAPQLAEELVNVGSDLGLHRAKFGT